MRFEHRALLFASVSLVSLMEAQPSFAGQQAPASQQASESVFDEIVVTARRVEENIQEVPMSVKAYDTNKLAQINIANISAVGKLVPGMASAGYGEGATVVGAGSSGKAAIYSRGIQGIPTYLNEVPFSQQMNGAFFDLASLQVLKGPQGTLFGIATNGGAMLFETQKPTNRLEGYGKVGVGSRLATNTSSVSRDFEAVVNVPVIDDTLLVRAGAITSVRPGYVFDTDQSKWFANRNYWDGRLQITYRNAGFQNEFFFNYYNSDNNGAVIVPTYFDLSPTKSFFVLFGQQAVNYARKQVAAGPYEVSYVYGEPGGSFQRTIGIDLINKTSYDINDDIQIKNIFGLERVRNWGGPSLSQFLANNKVVLANGTTPPKVPPGWQVSLVDEIQINGKLMDGIITYVVGNFNRWEYTSGPYNVTYSAGVFSIPTASRPNKNPARSNGLYGQATIDLDQFVEGLKLTGGYRRTWDARKVVATSLNPNTLAINTQTAVSSKANTPSYTVSVSYEPVRDITLFATNSESFSISGANTGVGLPEQYRRVKPESLNNIEYGIKSEFDIGIPVRANITGYRGTYKDAQQLITTSLISTVTNLPAIFSFTTNADRIRLWGWEGEFSIRPTEDLTIAFAGALQRYKFLSWIDPNGVDITNKYETLPLTPRTSYTVSIDYRMPFVPEDLGTLTFSPTYRYTGNLYNFSVRPADVRDGSPHYDQLDMTLNWSEFMGYQGLDMTFQLLNVNRNKRLGAMGGLYSSFGITFEAPAEPISWLLSAKYSF